jgi:pSer/pThr/pTyr-binding forkhead associated (FHA) protein
MTTQAPRKTPVAVPPIARSVVPRAPAAVPKPLVGPIAVTCGNVTLELRSGSLLIGRLSECDLVLSDTLVSRMHARIYVGAEGVRLEDLHSTNGVYVNGDRIRQTAALNVGDLAVIGTQELSFSEIGTDPAPPLSSLPPSGAEPSPAEPPIPPAPDTPRSLQKAAIPITARAEALDLLGTLARRLANEHKADQAPRMLGPHLRGILRGASSGLVVPDALAALASEYAIDLAHWTADSRWLDYVVELHLVTKRLMSSTVLAALQRAERWIGPMNRPLLEYYVNSFTSQPRELDASERSRLSLLRRILRKK